MGSPQDIEWAFTSNSGHCVSPQQVFLRLLKDVHSMNDRYLVSAGAGKAIIIWDYELDQQVARFGQQPNICVGLHVVHDKVISVTIDGVIRTFDIRQRAMVGQYKLSQLLRNAGHPEGDLGEVQWMQAKGCQLVVSILLCGGGPGYLIANLFSAVCERG